jgi:hypothetical protein
VRAHWLNPRRQGAEGEGFAAAHSPESGSFWFFDPRRTELLVKVLDGRTVNGSFWTVYGALSDLAYRLEVSDLVGGATRIYDHPAGSLCGGADVHSLPAAPEPPAPAATGRGGSAGAVIPAAGSAATPCTAAGSLCLQGGRFAAAVEWHDPRTGRSGQGRAVAASEESGFFWFFTPGNLELGVKVLDGRPVNGSWWLFWGALTDLDYDLTVTDRESGEQRSYHHGAGDVCGGVDIIAAH